jgi:aspartokinase-like uncharacterized kinase
MIPAPVRVIKLGGSLLGWPELTSRVRAWLACQPPAANILIVGGGPIVEKLRELDREHQFSPAAAHWLSIRAMSLTAAIVAELLEEAILVSSLEPLRLSPSAGLQILDVERFLREDQGSEGALPCGWHVTSDSIAARVATVLNASELVLLKSVLPASESSREAWSRTGFVDAHFARASSALAVRSVNLRMPGFPQIVPG